MEESEYFVIFEDDEQYCTVDRSDVICEDNVQIGDAVAFFWDKTRFEGVVKFMSDDFRQCDKMAETLTSEMKKHLSRQPSFHADKPRHAKVTGLQNLLGKRSHSPTVEQSASSNKKHSKSNSKSEKKKLKDDRESAESLDLLGNVLSHSRKKKNNILDMEDNDLELEATQEMSDNGDDTYTNDGNGTKVDLNYYKYSSEEDDESDESISSSSSDEKGSQQKNTSNSASKQLKYEAKLAKLQALIQGCKQSNNDARLPKSVLRNTEVPSDGKPAFKSPGSLRTGSVCSSIRNDGASTSTTNSAHRTPLKSPSADKSNKTSPVESPSVTGTSKTTSSPKKTPSPKKNIKGTIRSPPIAVSLTGKKYEGQMFLVTEPSENVKELLGPDGHKTGIYFANDAYKKADSASSASSAAHQLLTGVFTPEALAASSVTGLPPRGKGKASYANNTDAIKCYLCPKGVKAIIDQCLEWQKTKGLRPKVECGKIRTAISIKLCELHSSKNKE